VQSQVLARGEKFGGAVDAAGELEPEQQIGQAFA
jgi:hypothetical protein